MSDAPESSNAPGDASDTNPANQASEHVQMSFGEHLEELRKRLLYAIYGTVVCSVLTFIYGRELIAWLCRPLAHAQRNVDLPAQTVTMSVTSGFFIYMKVALIAALILASPWVVYQLWKFVSQGLYATERHAVVLLAPFSTLMTVLGVLFSYYVLLPMALAFLIFFSASYPSIPAGEPNLIDHVSRWARSLDLSTTGTETNTPPPAATAPHEPVKTEPHEPAASVPDVPALPSEAAGGITTERQMDQPSFVEVRKDDPPASEWHEGRWWLNTSMQELRTVVQGRLRVVPLGTTVQNVPLIELGAYINFVVYMILATVISFQLPVVMLLLGWTRMLNPDKLSRWRKYVVFICFVAAAVITPSGDPINMTILAVPLYVLFEFGLVLMRVTYRRAEKAAMGREDEDGPWSDGPAV